MKQKLFMVLAAMMLLVSTSASAQNVQQNEVNDTAALAAKAKAENQAAPKKTESQTPLKGDVNEDGKVDVADIAAVIKIMKDSGGTSEETKYYFSVGTTPITKDNYTTANNATTTIPTSSFIWSHDGPRNYVYILAPDNYSVTVVDNAINASFTLIEENVSISGHKVWKTGTGVAGGGFIKITLSPVYYWYVGTVNPMNVNTINPKDMVSDASSMGWRYIGATVPTYTMQNPLWNGQVNEIVFDNYKDITAYIALPNSVIKVRDGFGNDVTGQMKYLGEKEINGVTYTVYQNGNVVMAYSLDCLVY